MGDLLAGGATQHRIIPRVRPPFIPPAGGSRGGEIPSQKQFVARPSKPFGIMALSLRTCHSLQTLFMYHLFREEPAEAESTLARLLAIREKASGPNSPEVATVLDDLGDLFAALADRSSWQDFEAKIEGRPKAEWKSEQYGKKAEEFYKRALAIRERALKPDHPDIVDSLYNLGQLAMIWRQPADGEKFVERWWTLQEAAKVPASERQAKALVMLAAASMDRKDWAEADRRLARARASSRR